METWLCPVFCVPPRLPLWCHVPAEVSDSWPHHPGSSARLDNRGATGEVDIGARPGPWGGGEIPRPSRKQVPASRIPGEDGRGPRHLGRPPTGGAATRIKQGEPWGSSQEGGLPEPPALSSPSPRAQASGLPAATPHPPKNPGIRAPRTPCTPLLQGTQVSRHPHPRGPGCLAGGGFSLLFPQVQARAEVSRKQLLMKSN